MTGRLHKLNNLVPLDCQDGITIDNGSQLSTDHVGTSALLLDKHKMLLKNILHASQALSNVLLIHKLCVDNGVWVEFLPDCFYIKELHTRKVIFQGKSSQDYKLKDCTKSFRNPSKSISAQVHHFPSTVHALFSSASSNNIYWHAPFELIYFNLWTSPVIYITGAKYFLPLVDDHIEFMWIYFDF